MPLLIKVLQQPFGLHTITFIAGVEQNLITGVRYGKLHESDSFFYINRYNNLPGGYSNLYQ